MELNENYFMFNFFTSNFSNKPNRNPVTKCYHFQNKDNENLDKWLFLNDK